MDDAHNQLDLTVRLCAMFAVASWISVVLLVAHGRWLVVPALTGLLVWVAYRAAVRSAANYGETLQQAFDVHRFDLLRGLHYPLPSASNASLTFRKHRSFSALRLTSP